MTNREFKIRFCKKNPQIRNNTAPGIISFPCTQITVVCGCGLAADSHNNLPIVCNVLC